MFDREEGLQFAIQRIAQEDDLWVAPAESVEYGLVDRILERQPEIIRKPSPSDE